MTRMPNKAQRASLMQDAANHARWLRERQLGTIVHHIDEEIWTGLLTAALLTPSAGSVVLASLGFEGALTRVEPVVAPIDLVLEVDDGRSVTYKFLEAKGYGSPSNAPGYRSDHNATWQTDRLHSLAVGFAECARCGYVEACSEHGCPVCLLDLDDAPNTRKPPAWFESSMRTSGNEFVVLDFAGRDIETIYPDGICNDAWRVLTREAFLKCLRRFYDDSMKSLSGVPVRDVAGLVPLLTAGYADVRLLAA